MNMLQKILKQCHSNFVIFDTFNCYRNGILYSLVYEFKTLNLVQLWPKKKGFYTFQSQLVTSVFYKLKNNQCHTQSNPINPNHKFAPFIDSANPQAPPTLQQTQPMVMKSSEEIQFCCQKALYSEEIINLYLILK